MPRGNGSVARIRVRVIPRAGRDAVAGGPAGVLRVRVAAPPVAGAANAALVRLLAWVLGVPRNAVRIVHGAAGRDKIVEVDGLDEVEVWRRLGLPPPGAPGGG